MKKSKVTKILKMDKKDNYGNTSFIIEFENGDKGYYRSKTEEQTKFILQKDSEYNIEEKTGGTGSKYYTITVPNDQQGGGFKSGKPQIEPRVQMISFAAAYTKDLVVAGKVPIEKFDEQFRSLYKSMSSLI